MIYSDQQLQKYLVKRKTEEVQILKPAAFKRFNIAGYEFLSNTEKGIYPVFSYNVRHRIKKKLACNMVIVGEPRIGKSYLATDICRVIDRRFTIDHVVYRFKEFMKQVVSSKMGVPLTFDEPSYAMSKKDWYKEATKVLVFTIESMGFKVHPVMIPIINLNLLEKTIRTYLIQFMIYMQDRGTGKVYRLYPKQHEEGYYRYDYCDLKYGLFDNDRCKRDTCLDCSKLDTCEIFRAQYERKKRDIQDERYRENLETFSEKEAKDLSDEAIEKLLLGVNSKGVQMLDKIINDEGNPDPDKMRIELKEEWHIKIGRNRAYFIAKLLKHHYPNKFTMEAEI